MHMQQTLARSRPTSIKHTVLVKGTAISQYWLSYTAIFFIFLIFAKCVCMTQSHNHERDLRAIADNSPKPLSKKANDHSQYPSWWWQTTQTALFCLNNIWCRCILTSTASFVLYISKRIYWSGRSYRERLLNNGGNGTISFQRQLKGWDSSGWRGEHRDMWYDCSLKNHEGGG